MRRDWWLISDIDGTLTGDDHSLAELRTLLEEQRGRIGFGVASGRSPGLVDEAVERFGLPQPELVIASVGSELQFPSVTPADWPGRHLADWQPAELRMLLAAVPGVKPQAEAGQGPHKLGFLAAAEAADAAREAVRKAGLKANLLHSAGEFLDVLPEGVDKGSAVRFFAGHAGLGLDRIIVAGDTGNDRDMLLSGARAILVANHSPEVADLARQPGVYAAHGSHAAGILEGMRHFGIS